MRVRFATMFMMVFVLITIMCLDTRTDIADFGRIDHNGQTGPVTLVIAAQQTTARRTTDGIQEARALGLKSIAQLERMRAREDAFFVRRAKFLAGRLNEVNRPGRVAQVARVNTGAEFLKVLTLTSRHAIIGSLIIYGHSGSNGLFMLEDRGFYRSIEEVVETTRVASGTAEEKGSKLRSLGARNIYDLQELLHQGAIRFAHQSTIVMLGCNTAGNLDIDPMGIAALMAESTGATTFGSLNETDATILDKPAATADQEFSLGTWVRFAKGEHPKPLNTSAIDPVQLTTNISVFGPQPKGL